MLIVDRTVLPDGGGDDGDVAVGGGGDGVDVDVDVDVDDAVGLEIQYMPVRHVLHI